jgi:hypothetical protein
MKFLEACKGQDRSVVDWMVAHGIFPTVVKCPACNYDKLSCVLSGGTPRWQCRAEGFRKKVKSSHNVPGNWCLFLFFNIDTVYDGRRSRALIKTWWARARRRFNNMDGAAC